jgi:indole-3-glycerol phosphate synthase
MIVDFVHWSIDQWYIPDILRTGNKSSVKIVCSYRRPLTVLRIRKMILDKIIKEKRKEIKKSKASLPLHSFKSKIKKSTKNFKKAISKRLSIIAEIKRASPSEGIIRKDFDVRKIAKIYESAGARAISVLTDEKFFKGELISIKKVKKVTSLPLLRKDFIISEYQLYESRFYGADAVLLIAALLSKEKINKFINIAKRYKMDCLVEVHTEKELKKVLKTKAEIIGINNRNLDTLKVNLHTTIKLAKLIPGNKIIVGESGIKKRLDIKRVKDKINAVLIGTTLMRAMNIKKKIRELSG